MGQNVFIQELIKFPIKFSAKREYKYWYSYQNLLHHMLEIAAPNSNNIQN